MALPDRLQTRRLSFWEALAKAPQSFDFYAALRMMESVHPERPGLGRSRRPQDDAVRLGQEASLEFAPSTLSQVETRENGPPVLRQHFFGVMGPNGPLPLHMTEFVRDRIRNHGDLAMARFLDVFHHRLLSLFYRAWAQAQPVVGLDRPGADRFATYLGALIGLSERTMTGRDAVPDDAKRAYAGLLGRQSRNASGLASILRGFFRVDTRIEEFTPHWMELPTHLHTRLGGDLAQLSRTAVIGQRVWDMQSKFRVVIGPLTLAQYERFLPGQPSQKRLADWVRNYVGYEFKWDCRVVLKQAEVPALILGFAGRLGWTSWLGTRLADTDAGDLVVAGKN